VVKILREKLQNIFKRSQKQYFASKKKKFHSLHPPNPIRFNSKLFKNTSKRKRTTAEEIGKKLDRREGR
jgi:hypothetical protein